MLAKIIAYGANREEARRRLVRAIEDSTLFGVTVNSHFLCEVLRHTAFIDGEATTAFIGEDFADNPSMQPQTPAPLAIGIATLISFLEQRPQHDFTQELAGWSNTGQSPWPYQLKHGDERWSITLEHRDDAYMIRVGEHALSLQVVSDDGTRLVYVHEGVRSSCVYHISGNEVFLRVGSQDFVFEDATHAAITAQEGAGTGEIKASMDGAIIEVNATAGARVSRGQTLVILEAMKMEHPLKADVDGTIEEVRVQAGDQVKLRQLLVSITPDEENAE